MAKLPDSFYKDITKTLNSAKSLDDVRSGFNTAYAKSVKQSLGISKGSFFDKVISSKSDKKTSSVESISSSTIRVLSKNSMFLPVIAKEMNIMRQNIQLMVKKQGLTPKNKSDSSLTSTGQTTSVPSATKSGKSKGNVLGNSTESEGGSEGSSILGSMIGGVMKARLVLPAIIGLLSAGYLTSVLYRALPFRKIASDFTKIFNDALTGMAQFFGLDGFLGGTIEKIRKFFGMKEEEGFLDVIARKLDETFKTTFFSDNLNRAGNLIRNAAEDTVIFLKNAYATIMKYVSATMMTTGDLMNALGRDVKNYLLIWLDSNRVELYTVIGGVLGAVLGSIFPSVVGTLGGGAIGAAYGRQRAQHDENEKNKIIAQYKGNIEAPLSKASLIAANLKNFLDFHEKSGSDRKFIDESLKHNPDVLKNHAKLQGFDENFYVGKSGIDLDWIREEYEKAAHTSRVLGGALLAKKGTNELGNFDIVKRQEENLKTAEKMYPLEKYPTRVYPVNTLDYRKPEGTHAFGANRTNSKGQSYKHGGVDYLGHIGDPIFAMQDGIAQVKEQRNGMGKYIIIKGANGSTVYGHISEAKVKTGDSVKYGQQIAEMGDTGNASGQPQLHFEAYSGDAFTSTRLNPEEFLKGLPARPTMDSPTGNKNSLISDVTQSAEKNFIDPLVKKFDEMIAAFMAKDTNVVVNTSSESIPAEPYSEEQLSHYKLSGINF